MVKVRENMTGWKMWEHGVPDSRLTVIEQVEDYISPNGIHAARYLCECNCENRITIIAKASHIKSGNILSCGCLQSERTHKANKKYNTYDLSGDFGIGYCSNTNNPFYFDLKDYDKIKNYCWCEIICQDGYHALRAYDIKTNAHIRMHHVLGCKGYDHIDRNPLNNRRNNLRKATITENAQNHSLRKDNKSGCIGVRFDAIKNKWEAAIQVNKASVYIGIFINKEDAIRARLEAEAKYYGEFAPQQHLFEQYGITIQNELEVTDEL